MTAESSTRSATVPTYERYEAHTHTHTHTHHEIGQLRPQVKFSCVASAMKGSGHQI
jgi:hypothetical protein